MGSGMQGRLVPKTVQAGPSLIRLASQAGGPETAERASQRLLAWLPKVVQGTALQMWVADVHRGLGNHYQAVGRTEDAVTEFDQALAVLNPLSGDRFATRIRQLEFNRANGLARSGREAEAIAVYERLEGTFDAEGEQEAALRTRYARLHLQWRTARGTAILDDLRRLVAEYQALLRSVHRDKE